MSSKSISTVLFLGIGLAACDSSSTNNPDGGGGGDCPVAPVLTVFASRCSNAGCHVPGGQYPELTANGLSTWISQKSHEMTAASLVTPGNPETSWIYRKVAGMQGASGGALMPLGTATPIAEAATIRDWIAAGAPTTCNGDGGVATPPTAPDPNTLNQGALFTCPASPSPASSVSRIRRIDNLEWSHAISQPTTAIHGATAYQNPYTNQSGAAYSTYASGLSVDSATLELSFATLPLAGLAWDAKYAAVPIAGVYRNSAFDCLFATANPSTACIDSYIDSLLTLSVLSRTPTTDEHALLRAYLVAAIGREPGGGSVAARQATLDELVSAAFLMPGALFRSELGVPSTGDPAGRLRLSNEELALAVGSLLDSHRPGAPMSVAFGYTPPPPDDVTSGWLGQVRVAAKDGTIQDPAVIRKLIVAYATGSDPNHLDLLFENDGRTISARGEYWLAPRIAGFFREWLAYSAAANAFKDTPAATSQYPANNSLYDPINTSYTNLQTRYFGFDSTLLEQLDDTIARTVIDAAQSRTSPFKALMTTRLWRLPSDLSQANGQVCKVKADCTNAAYPTCTSAGICVSTSYVQTSAVDRPYNLVNVPNTPAGRWVTMSPSERSGVLTHPTWLAAHGDNFEDDASLVHRGRWIREKLFCQTVPGLQNVMVQAMLGARGPSARERVTTATTMGPNAQTCLGCHSQMNTLGLPFEIYNHAGFVRTTDHNAKGTPDGTTTVTNAPDPALNGSFSSALDFTQSLATSQYAKRCFIRQAFRYFNGRDETMQDACTLRAMESALDNGSFVEMLTTLATSDTFLYRSTNGGSP